MKVIEGGINAPIGFEAAGIEAGIKYQNRKDMAIVFMISTGIRVGELGALKWGDIDYKKNVVKITKTVARISNSEYIIKNKPKTKKSIREIPLSKTAKDALVSQRRKTEILAIDGNIFPTSEGGLLHKGIINAAISNVLEKIELSQKIKIEHFTSHALRATFATRAIEQGMTPQTLKTIMGHSSYKMTMDLYAHVLPNTKQKSRKLLTSIRQHWMQKIEINKGLSPFKNI